MRHLSAARGRALTTQSAGFGPTMQQTTLTDDQTTTDEPTITATSASTTARESSTNARTMLAPRNSAAATLLSVVSRRSKYVLRLNTWERELSGAVLFPHKAYYK
jgi:hypothetical protein